MEDQRILITYFSVFPAKDKFTEKFAKVIANKTGGRLVEIQCATKYPQEPSEYPEIEKMAYEERDSNVRPAIMNEIPIADADVIFVGYPIWCYTLPQVMFTLFDQYDFSGKTLIPFNTHEGSGDGGTYETIKKLEPDANVLNGLAIRGFDMEKNQDEVIETWLKQLGFLYYQ